MASTHALMSSPHEEAPQEDALLSAFTSNPVWWAFASMIFGIVGYAIAQPIPCSEVEACEMMHGTFPSKLNATAAMGLSFVWLYEVINLVSTYRGVSETKALVPDIRSRCLPSALLTVMFSVLIAQHSTFASGSTAWYVSARLGAAAPGDATVWPLYTITYVEWLIIVPLLLTAAGHCAIHRPLTELARPIVVTNFYIVLSWMAMLTTNETARWALVIVSFALYFFASYDMFEWVVEYYRTAPADLPSRNLRPCLSIGLVLLFAVYGVVFLMSLAGSMTTWAERMSFLFLDVGSKLAMGASFVVIRGNEYHRTLTSVLKRVGTSNVALVSILRGSFDFMLPCTIDQRGVCVLPEKSAADMVRLESELGRPIAGKRLADLLADDEERNSLLAYVRNTLRQAEGHGSFSSVTLSTQGEWTSGHLPPVAQVLNCRMACGGDAPGGRQKTIQCAIHLSVVPNSSFSIGRSVTQLVAAVRFEQDHMPSLPEDASAINEPSFEPFDAAEANKDVDGIVASLNDIANLGMSSMLKSVRGDSVSGDDDASTAPSSVTSLAKLATKKLTNSTRSPSTDGSSSGASVAKLVSSQLRGSWRGRASQALGGYEQTFRFLDDGKHLQIALLGKVLLGEYTINCSQSPYHLDLQVLCEDGGNPPPLPYIFDIANSGALTICGPADEAMKRPMKFDGAGLCVLERVVSAAEGAKAQPPPPQDKMMERAETCSTSARTETMSTRRGNFRRGPPSAASTIPGLGGGFAGSRQTSAGSSAGNSDFAGDDLGFRPAHLDTEPAEVGQSPPTAQKKRAGSAGGGSGTNTWANSNDSMFLLQLATVAQVGIAATSLAVFGVSALRRRS